TGISGDTWVWNGQAWSQRTPVLQPPPRWATKLAWDPARSRLVMFGGDTGSYNEVQDVWEWDGASWSLVPTPTPPTARAEHAVATSPDGAGIVAILGRGRSTIGDAVRLRWDTAAGGGGETCTSVDVDGDTLAGCKDPDCWRVCSPMCPPGVTSCA